MKVNILTKNGDDFMYNLPIEPDEIGGEGKIYPISSPRYGKFYLKIYTNKCKAKANEEKVKYLFSTQPPFEHQNIRYCWPIGIVKDPEGVFCGFMMESAFETPEGNSVSMVMLTDYNLDENLAIRYPQDLRWHKLYELDTVNGLLNRLRILWNLAKAINGLHKTGHYCLVDLKPENVFITCGGKISIIDIDSIQIYTTNNFYKATAFTPNYFPADAYSQWQKERPINTSCDVFSFACCAYMMLTGTHPYNNVKLLSPYSMEKYNLISSRIKANLYLRGEKANYIRRVDSKYDLHAKFDRLPKCVQNLFNKTFSDDLRPTMEDWLAGLREGIKSFK